MKSFAILTDVTRCIGCEQCVTACQQEHLGGSDDAPWRWQDDATSLSGTRWTTMIETQGRHVREQCRHCLEPACVAACPVGALATTDEGAVIYDPDICLGCRYCILACSFRAVRFDYGSANPSVGKCILCYEKLKDGSLKQPACTAACPTQATIFGDRDELIAEAKRRIAAEPDKYLNHIWGEKEAGGTSVLYISDVDLVEAGWPAFVDDEPLTHLTHTIMGTVPFTFCGVAAGLAGVSWVIKRRQKLAALETAGDEEGEAIEAPEIENKSESEETK